MFDLPLHPLVVHLPIVLGTCLPFIAIFLWWGIGKGHIQKNVWLVLTVLALIYSASAIVGSVTGEDDEDKVEKLVSEKVIEEHEEASEPVAWIAGGLAVVSLAGFLLKNPKHSRNAKLAFVVLSLVAILPLANAGHTGIELVYKYGAATAYLSKEVRTNLSSEKGMPLERGEKDGEGEKEEDDD